MRRRAKVLTAAMTCAVMAVFGLASTAVADPGDHGPAAQAAPQATLVRTDIFLPAPARNGGHGKPAPTTANCSNDEPSQYGTTPVYTGFTSTVQDRTAVFNANTVPAGLTSAVSDLQAAFNAWTAENPSAPPFTVASSTTEGVTKQTANRHTDVLFGRTPGNALAVTYTWQWSDTGEYESDTVFNQRVDWTEIHNTTGPNGTDDGCDENVVAYDLQNIATHEFGHIYGLGHPAGDRFATMYGYGYTGETLKRTLATSDSTGIDSLY